MEENNNLHSGPEVTKRPELTIDYEVRSFLKETIRWTRFLAIMGYIAAGIIVLIGVLMISLGSKLTEYLQEDLAFPGVVGVFYILLGILYFFPAQYLDNFSVNIREALSVNDQESFIYAFSKLKSYFKFWGILVLILLIFYVLVFVVAIFAGLMGVLGGL